MRYITELEIKNEEKRILYIHHQNTAPNYISCLKDIKKEIRNIIKEETKKEEIRNSQNPHREPDPERP